MVSASRGRRLRERRPLAPFPAQAPPGRAAREGVVRSLTAGVRPSGGAAWTGARPQRRLCLGVAEVLGVTATQSEKSRSVACAPRLGGPGGPSSPQSAVRSPRRRGVWARVGALAFGLRSDQPSRTGAKSPEWAARTATPSRIFVPARGTMWGQGTGLSPGPGPAAWGGEDSADSGAGSRHWLGGGG